MQCIQVQAWQSPKLCQDATVAVFTLQQCTKTAVMPQEARVLNHATWNPIAHLSHPAGVNGPTGVVAYKEIAEAPSSSVCLQPRKSRYILCEMPVKVPQQKVPLDKANVRLGVGEHVGAKRSRQCHVCILCRVLLANPSSSVRSLGKKIEQKPMLASIAAAKGCCFPFV